MTLETLFWIAIITPLVVGLTVYTVACLFIKDVVDWFRKKSAIKQADKNNIAFTLQDRLASGKYKTVQGIFNKGDNKLKEGRVIESNEIDQKMQNLHSDNELVLYN